MLESILSISFPAAFVAGVIMVFLPCTYPLCLGYLALIAGDTGRGKVGKVVFLTLWFFVGFAFVYTLLGSAAGIFGQFTATTLFLTELQHILLILGGIFFLAIGLVMLQIVPLPSFLKGVHSIPFPRWLTPHSWWGATLLGAIFAASWSPCIGPVLGGILLLAASSGSFWYGALLLFVFSLGIMTPLLILSVLLSALSSRISVSDRFLSSLRFLAGVLFILLGVAFLFADFSFLGSLAPPSFFEDYI